MSNPHDDGRDELPPLTTEPPVDLCDDETKEEYRRIAVELTKLDHICDLHRNTLSDYCGARYLMRSALTELESDGVTLIGSAGGKYRHPAMDAWSMAQKMMTEHAKALGLIPEPVVLKREPEEEDEGPSRFCT